MWKWFNTVAEEFVSSESEIITALLLAIWQLYFQMILL